MALSPITSSSLSIIKPKPPPAPAHHHHHNNDNNTPTQAEIDTMARDDPCAFRLPGFAFTKEPPFGDDKDLERRLMGFVEGYYDPNGKGNPKNCTDRGLTVLFQECLHYSAFFDKDAEAKFEAMADNNGNVVLSDDDPDAEEPDDSDDDAEGSAKLKVPKDPNAYFWQCVRFAWHTSQYLAIPDIRKYVKTYVDARKRINPPTKGGGLAKAVDSFIDRSEAIAKKNSKLKKAIKLEYNRRYGFKQTAAEKAEFETLLASLRTDDKLDLSHYSAREISWITEGHVYDSVKQFMEKNNRDAPAIPDSCSHPLDVQSFLAWTALKNLKADRKTALFMKPIMFWEPSERKDWQVASGYASRLGATAGEFGKFAFDQFKIHDRDTVVGFGLSQYRDDLNPDTIAKNYNPRIAKRRDFY
ncbi:hypothetical protein F5Y16DRAFT_422757 [Xylariaceae sp. FL0255]|nr:hypothetical protein F5Y16DRAFT_422757 [Xylariaceae sp. FL0255]